jgi:hypothetical protein
MEHTKSKTIVYHSSDYKRFRMVDGNRAINKNKIARIIKEIKEGNDVLDESPILVTESRNSLEIKDGQHRFMVAQELKRPVHYILKGKDMSIFNVARVNSNTEKWKGMDFINAYSKSGNHTEDYKTLGKFHKEYGFAITACLILLAHGSLKSEGSNESLTAQFQNGTFQVKKLKEARLFAELCKIFDKHPGWNGRGFTYAVSRIIACGQCDFDVLKKKFLRDPLKLTSHPNWKGYADNLQRIYNFDNSKQRVIY